MLPLDSVLVIRLVILNSRFIPTVRKLVERSKTLPIELVVARNADSDCPGQTNYTYALCAIEDDKSRRRILSGIQKGIALSRGRYMLLRDQDVRGPRCGATYRTATVEARW